MGMLSDIADFAIDSPCLTLAVVAGIAGGIWGMHKAAPCACSQTSIKDALQNNPQIKEIIPSQEVEKVGQKLRTDIKANKAIQRPYIQTIQNVKSGLKI